MQILSKTVEKIHDANTSTDRLNTRTKGTWTTDSDEVKLEFFFADDSVINPVVEKKEGCGVWLNKAKTEIIGWKKNKKSSN